MAAAGNGRYPGLADYIVDERGTLRKHVNIFIDGTMITDRHTLHLFCPVWVIYEKCMILLYYCNRDLYIVLNDPS